MQGYKVYGAHLGPFKTPARESDPGVPALNLTPPSSRGSAIFSEVKRGTGMPSGLAWWVARCRAIP
jgi:hypothetical protein